MAALLPRPGEVLHSVEAAYLVESVLNKGGTSYIVKVKGPDARLYVAKVLHGERIPIDDAALRLFEREVRLQAS